MYADCKYSSSIWKCHLEDNFEVNIGQGFVQAKSVPRGRKGGESHEIASGLQGD
jgi:hypothetical protein